MAEEIQGDFLPPEQLPDEPPPEAAEKPAAQAPSAERDEVRRLERDRDHWREQALRNASTQAPNPDEQPEAPPKESDFDDYSEFERARIGHEVRQEVANTFREQERRTRDAQRIEAARSRLVKARERYKDFEKVAFADDVPLSRPMLHAMEDSDHFGDIAYYLGSNPEEAHRITQLSPAAAAREIGRIEDRFLTPPEPKTTTASAKSGKTGGKATKHPSKMDYDEYKKWRESGGG